MLLKIFYDRAEVNRLGRKSAILRDFGLIQHFESIALEQFEAASAVECHHLRVDLFDAMVVQVTKVGLQKLASDLDRLSGRKKIDVEMPDGPGCRRALHARLSKSANERIREIPVYSRNSGARFFRRK